MKLCTACSRSFGGPDWRCPACGFAPPVRDGFVLHSPEEAGDTEGFESCFFDQLAAAENGNFWFESRNNLIAWTMSKYFPGAATGLEIGCGTGFVLARLRYEFPNLQLVGTEVLVDGLTRARVRVPDVTLCQMDARRMPFEDEFDVVCAFDVLEHIEDDRAVLREMYRATRPGGGIIVTVPQHAWLWSAADDYAHHVRRYEARDLVDKVREAGFRISLRTAFVSLLLPAMLASRLKRKENDARYDPMAELSLSPQVNAVLRSLMNGETAIIRNGVRFPFGGSLLVVGCHD